MKVCNILSAQKIFEATRLSRVQDPVGMMKMIEAEIKKSPAFFRNLEPLNGIYRDSIRIYEPSSLNVLVKFCGFEYSSQAAMDAWYKTGVPKKPENISGRKAVGHGAMYNEYFEFFNIYRRAAKDGEIKPDGYALFPITVFGLIRAEPKDGNIRVYLVMERLFSLEGILEGSNEYSDILSGVMRAFRRDAKAISRKIDGWLPELRDPLILGNTCPANYHNGIWVLALPHDIA